MRVVMMVVSPSVVVVPGDSSIKDLKGLIAASRKGTGLNFATAGTGSTPHFVAEILKLKADAKQQILPFKSGSEASLVVLAMVKAGKLRGVASPWNRRMRPCATWRRPRNRALPMSPSATGRACSRPRARPRPSRTNSTSR